MIDIDSAPSIDLGSASPPPLSSVLTMDEPRYLLLNLPPSTTTAAAAAAAGGGGAADVEASSTFRRIFIYLSPEGASLRLKMTSVPESFDPLTRTLLNFHCLFFKLPFFVLPSFTPLAFP